MHRQFFQDITNNNIHFDKPRFTKLIVNHLKYQRSVLITVASPKKVIIMKYKSIKTQGQEYTRLLQVMDYTVDSSTQENSSAVHKNYDKMQSYLTSYSTSMK